MRFARLRLGVAPTRRENAMSKRRNKRPTRAWKDALFAQSPALPCHYCGEALTRKTATVDHVVPLSRGGANAPVNFVLAMPCVQQPQGAGPHRALVGVPT